MMSPKSTEHRFVWLTSIRWLPVGIMFASTILLPVERGLSTLEVGTLLAIQGFAVLGLELPSGSLSDTIGRRPVLITSGMLAILATTLFLLANDFWGFALSFVMQGVFRALESGSLESWFVDTVHAQNLAAELSRPLAAANTALGVAIACGALAGGLLTWWNPFTDLSALALPVLVATACYIFYTALCFFLVRDHEPRPVKLRFSERVRELRTSLREVPNATRDGLRLAATSRVLRGLIFVELFWALALVGFEALTPLRLGELLPSEQQAAALFGVASAAGWLCFAAGSFVAGIASTRIGNVWMAILSRLLNGAFVVLIGVAAGPVGVITAFGLSYLTHGLAGPAHSALLHGCANTHTRATVLSLNSMVSGGAYSLGLLALTAFAEVGSLSFAIIAAGGLSLLGALCYLPALAEARRATHAPLHP